MSKALLVIRRMPDTCNECQFCSEGKCYAARDSHHNPEEVDFYDKPDWCPLKEIPKKKPDRAMGEWLAFNSGYNACIDKIMGQEQ